MNKILTILFSLLFVFGLAASPALAATSRHKGPIKVSSACVQAANTVYQTALSQARVNRKNAIKAGGSSLSQGLKVYRLAIKQAQQTRKSALLACRTS